MPVFTYHLLLKMRPLTDEEAEKVFAKLATFIGDNVALLLDRADGNYCFRNHKVSDFNYSKSCLRSAYTTVRKTLCDRPPVLHVNHFCHLEHVLGSSRKLRNFMSISPLLTILLHMQRYLFIIFRQILSFSVQSLVEAKCRTTISLRKQHTKVWYRKNDRRNPISSRHCRL